MIYLDNAATTIYKPKIVADAVYEAIYSQKFANPSRGAYPASINSLKELNLTRMAIGKFFGHDDPLSVVLSENVTYALNFIIQGLLSPEDHVITSVNEHNSVLRPLYNLQRQGMGLSILGLDENLNIKLDDLESLVQPNTKAIFITGASNVSGKVTDLKKVHDFRSAHGLILVIDGAQLAGSQDFDLEDFDQTIFAFTGHKSLHGPGGTGGFIAKGDFDFKEVFSGGSGYGTFEKHQPQSLPELYEPGTHNVHSFAGLRAAIEEINSIGLDKIVERERLLRNKLYYGFKEIPGLKFYTQYDHGDSPNGPLVSINIGDIPSGEVARILWDKYEICVRSGAHCAPLFHEAVGTVDQGIVRFSLSYYNKEEEVDAAISAVKDLAEELL